MITFVQSIHSSFRRQLLRKLGIFAVAVSLIVAQSSPASAADREVVSRVKATYPEMAKRLKITGTVLLNATVTPAGHVKAVSTIMGNNMLAEAAKEAVSKWKFAPADNQTIEEVEVEFP